MNHRDFRILGLAGSLRRNSASPTETLLEFMESAYRAGTKSAGWDIEALRPHPPAREAAKVRRGN